MDVWKIPAPATSLYGSPHFVVLPHRQCALDFSFEGEEMSSQSIRMIFSGVDSFRCTYGQACTAEMFNVSYGKLVEIEESEFLRLVIKNKRTKTKPHHYQITFDGGPSYDLIAANFDIIEF